MQFAIWPYFLSPQDSEPELQKLHTEIQRYLKRTLLSIDTYASLYNKYLDIWDAEKYLKYYILLYENFGITFL